MDWKKEYWDCVETCQRMGSELAELEDALFDESGVEGDELIDCVHALIAERDNYKWMYEGLCK